MHSERTEAALRWMQDSIVQAVEWTGALTSADFEHDRRTFYAVVRCLEIVSEASRRLPNELLARHPGYDWRRMRDAGNVYRHVYEGVVEHRVFETVRDFLPPLLAIIEQELAGAGP